METKDWGARGGVGATKRGLWWWIGQVLNDKVLLTRGSTLADSHSLTVSPAVHLLTLITHWTGFGWRQRTEAYRGGADERWTIEAPTDTSEDANRNDWGQWIRCQKTPNHLNVLGNWGILQLLTVPLGHESGLLLRHQTHAPRPTLWFYGLDHHRHWGPYFGPSRDKPRLFWLFGSFHWATELPSESQLFFIPKGYY